MKTYLPQIERRIIVRPNQTYEQFPLNEMFTTLKIKNRGISGSASGDVLKSVRGLNIPNTVFLLVGVNDFFYNVQPDITIKNITAILDLLHTKNSKAKIYVQSVLPVRDAGMTKKIVALDKRISSLSKEHNAAFINLFPYFVTNNGQMRTEYTVDGIHLSSEGYRVWTDQVKKYIPQSAL